MPKAPDIFVANCSAYVQYDGKSVFIRKGITTVRAGHALLKANESMVSPFTVQYDLEQPAPARAVKPTPRDTTETREA